MRLRLFTLMFFTLSKFYSQNSISCDEILEKIEKNNKLLGKLSAFDLLYEASWLKEVKCYESEKDVYVVAEFYLNDALHSTKKYIYCNVPKINWDFFSNRSQCCPLDLEDYGKRFHKYIADYKCNCE